MSDETTSHSAGASGEDPLSELLRRLGLNPPGDGVDLNALMGRIQAMMAQAQAGADSATGIDWAMARRTARQVAASLGPDPVPSPTQRAQLADSHRLAESWLGPAVSFEACPAQAQAWSRAQWVEDTMDSWHAIVEPVVTAIAEAMSTGLGGEAAAELPEIAQLTGMLAPVMRMAAGQMYTAQLAQAIGEISAEVVSGDGARPRAAPDRG